MALWPHLPEAKAFGLWSSALLNAGIWWISPNCLFLVWDFFPLPYFPIKETKTFHWVQFLDHFKADGAFQYLCTHTWKWTLCDPSGAAFLTCAPSSAAAWCSPEAAAGGQEEAPITFPNARKWHWKERLVWDGSPQTAPTWLWLCCFLVPAPPWLLTTPDSAAHQTNTGATVRLLEAGRGPNAQELGNHQMLRTPRKLTLFAISVD